MRGDIPLQEIKKINQAEKRLGYNALDELKTFDDLLQFADELHSISCPDEKLDTAKAKELLIKLQSRMPEEDRCEFENQVVEDLASILLKDTKRSKTYYEERHEVRKTYPSHLEDDINKIENRNILFLFSYFRHIEDLEFENRKVQTPIDKKTSNYKIAGDLQELLELFGISRTRASIEKIPERHPLPRYPVKFPIFEFETAK